ncbi:MAG TPA: hypothetical protein VLC28_06410, partial [Flavitalea sp.]|nr:hypothetical protein [Flavitalea sp.]
MKYLAITLLVCISLPLWAQYNPDRVGKKATALYTKALEKARDGLFKEGIAILNDAVRIDPRFADAYLSIAGMYGELKNYHAAIENYQKAKAIDPNYFQDYNLPYSINLAGEGKFQEALNAANEFLAVPGLSSSSIKAASYRAKTYQFALDYPKTHPTDQYKFEPRNLGDSINSDVSEYFPALTIDGSRLIYTRRVKNFNEDFYESESKAGSWTKSSSLEGSINTASNEGAQNISQDGQWLIFTGCNFPDTYGSCDLYISYLTADGWSEPENLGNQINSESWESAPSLSPDKRDLYFASTRPGGYGASDIYVTHRQPNGTWSDPENLGPSVNTAGNESCPFIHADNQSLYFTSNGHLGYGGDDLFLVTKKGVDKWSEPVNLGYPINTIENEGSLIVAADGKTAYYASDRSDSRGGLDLYTFELRSDIRPAKTLWVSGKVFDKETQKGLPSAVELTDLATKELLSKVQTDETGNYLVTLPIGKDYAFNVNRKGYLLFSENFSLGTKTPDSTYHIDIPLQPITTDASVVLKNIFFDVKRSDLKPESAVELDQVVRLLKDNPSVKIQILGHTDNVGK